MTSDLVFFKNFANRGFAGSSPYVCENGWKPMWLLHVVSTTYMVSMLPFFENATKAPTEDAACDLFQFPLGNNYKWL